MSDSVGKGASRFRRLGIAAVVVAVLALAYAGIGFLAVPGWIAAGAKDAVRKQYRRELGVGAVRFNPFTLAVEIDDLSLPDVDGPDLLHWHHLRVQFQALASLWRRGYVFHSIELDGPGVRVVRRKDGRLNVQDLVPASRPPSPKAAPAAPLRLWIDSLAVHGGEGVLVDRARAEEHTEKFSPVDFELANFSTVVASGDRYQLRAASPDLGSIEWHGTIVPNPVHSAGEFRFADVNLPRVSQWVTDILPFGVTGGVLGLSGRYDISMAGDDVKLDAEVDELAVAALGLRARGEAEDWIGVPRIEVSAVQFALPSRRLHVGKVAVHGARIAVALDATMQPNLLRLLPPSAAPAGAPAPGATPPPFAAAAPLVHWTLEPVDVALSGISWPAEAPSRLDAAIVVDGSGRLEASGAVDVAQSAVDLDVDVSRLALASLQPLVAKYTSMVLNSGAVAAKGKVTFRPDAGAHFTGALGCADLRISDPVVREDLVRWKGLDVTGVDVATKPLAVAVREVVVKEPYARLIIAPDGTTNLSDALAPPGTRPAAPAAKASTTPAAKPVAKTAARPRPAAVARAAPAKPAGPGLPIEIRRVRVVNGSMNYADYTLKPKFATGIVQLHGTIDGLSGKPDARATVTLDGKVDEFAPVTIRGKVNYFAANSFTDLTMSFHNIELTTFSPYSGKFAGYRIDRGKLSLDANYLVVDRKLEAKHHVVINQLQLGDRVDSPDAVSLPLKLAVALLKDRNGVIDLDLPVSGSLDDPTFAVGPIIWKIVKNLLVKIVTSPFALLGSLFGGGEEMQFVDFAPGSAVLDAANVAKVANLRKALESRPALNLNVPLVAVAEDDRPALAEAHWSEFLGRSASTQFGDRARAPDFLLQLRARPPDYLKLLETAYVSALGHKPEVPKPPAPAAGAAPVDRTAAAITWLEGELRQTVTVGDDELSTLAKTRADAVQRALLEGGEVDPSRVFVVTEQSKSAAPPAAPAGSTAGRVRVQLSLT